MFAWDFSCRASACLTLTNSSICITHLFFSCVQLGDWIRWILPRDLCRTSVFQPLLLVIVFCRVLCILSWPECWWSCSRSQTGAWSHCRDAGGRQRGRTDSEWAGIWMFLSEGRLWTAVKRKAEKEVPEMDCAMAGRMTSCVPGGRWRQPHSHKYREL